MDNDVVLEPGAEPASVEGSASSQINDGGDIGSLSSNDSNYVPEKVFDVSSDLNIKQLSQDAAGPIQYEDSKFKNVVIDPLNKDMKDIGGAVSETNLPKSPFDTTKPIFKPSSSPIPPPAPLPPLTPPIMDEINSILANASIGFKKPTTPNYEELDQASAAAKLPPLQAKPIQESVPTPITTYSSIPAAEKKVPSMHAIRTFEGDIASSITRKGTSTAEMVMAQEKRETGEDAVISNKEPSHSGKKMTMILVSLILIGAGVVGAYYLFSISPLAPAKPIQGTAKVISLVPSDSQTTVAMDGLTAISAIDKIRNKINESKPAGTIEEIIPYTTTGEIRNRLTTAQMLDLLDINAPNILARSLTPSWMLGVYTDKQNRNNVFIVTTNNFFQNAFSGMLSWESVMADDLKQYLYPTSVTGIANTPTSYSQTLGNMGTMNPLENIDSLLRNSGTSTGSTATSTANSTSSGARATSTRLITTTASSTQIGTGTTTASSSLETDTTPVIPYFTLRGQFHDKIIKNKDVREFVTANGDILFLYSFIDNKNLIITSNEATLSEIITRLEKEAFVR